MNIRESAERLKEKCYQPHPVTEFQRDINAGVDVSTSWLDADGLFREMCQRGETSPELRVYRTVGGTGHTMWAADYGGFHGWSVTPWGAVEDLGRKIQRAQPKPTQSLE